MAFGAADYAHDVRLACHGLDRDDNDFVIGLIGKDLFPLSAVVQAMRKTQQTSLYLDRLGPFFVGRADVAVSALGGSCYEQLHGEFLFVPSAGTPSVVSALGLGGYHLGKIATEREAIRIVHAAIDAGITFMDNAWEYHEGESEIRMGKAIKDRRDRVFLMTKVCTHGRDAKAAMRQLEQSLRRLQTDYLDLWQIHECAYYNDPERHFAQGGVVEALERARKQGQGPLRRVHRSQGSGDPPADAVVRVSVRQLPAAAERVRRDVPQLRAARAAGAAAAARSRRSG